MADWKAKLKALHPCPEAYRWAIKHRTLRQAWLRCELGEWMTWLLLECDYGEVADAAWEVRDWGRRDDLSCIDENLVEAYIILDFMPDPPTLPDV